MKKMIQPITAATNSGTSVYKLTAQDIIENCNWGDNIWVQYILDAYPLDQALDLNSLEGSRVFGDTLYLLISDYKPVQINGKVVEPEELLFDSNFDAFESLISEPDKSIIARNITSMDFNWDILDIEESAKDLLDEYSLLEVALQADDVDLIKLT